MGNAVEKGTSNRMWPEVVFVAMIIVSVAGLIYTFHSTRMLCREFESTPRFREQLFTLSSLALVAATLLQRQPRVAG